jgi:hypothetical protein
MSTTVENSIQLKQRNGSFTALDFGPNQYFVYVLLIFYFIVPHHLFFQIFGIRELKPFDLVVPILGAYYLGKKINFRGLRPLLLLCGVYLLRSIFSLHDIGEVSIAYAVKLFEYFVVILCIKDLRPIYINRLLVWYAFFSVLFVILELAGVNLGLGWGGRMSGQFGGPYELASIALLFLFFFRKEITRRIVYLAVIISAGTKAAYLAILAALVLRMKVVTVVPTIIFLAFLFTLSIIVNERFSIFFSNLAMLFEVDLILRLWDSVPIIENHEQYLEAFSLRETGLGQELDLSTGSRLITYLTIVKAFDIIVLLVGHGPGFFGAAVDSSLLRLLGELGIMGLILGYQTIKALMVDLASSRSAVLIVLAIIALSDVFFSARFLPTLFLLNQYASFKSYRNT